MKHFEYTKLTDGQNNLGEKINISPPEWQLLFTWKGRNYEYFIHIISYILDQVHDELKRETRRILLFHIKNFLFR